MQAEKMEANRTNDISELITAVSEHQNLNVRKKNLMTGLGIGVVAGGLGLAFGPVGIVAGAAVGSVASVWMNGERPLTEVIKDLANDLKEKLYTGVKALLGGWNWPSLEVLLKTVMSSNVLLQNITDYLKMFLKPLNMMVLA